MSVEQSNQKKLLPPMCAEQSEQEVVHLEVKHLFHLKSWQAERGLSATSAAAVTSPSENNTHYVLLASSA